MAATAEQIARLRRMAGESNPTTYSDSDIAAYIERYPILDALGNDPWVESETTPTTLIANPDWTATYDLNAAAADLWAEKAAGLAARYDFSTQGQSFSRSQGYEMAQKQSRYYRSRRAVGTIAMRPEPKPDLDELLDEE